MPFEIVRNDIVKVTADAIVNTANPKPLIGAGTDYAIHRDAGPELLEARKAIGNIQSGQVAVTPAFGLNAKYVIHAVGPVWKGGTESEEEILRQTYDNALEAAVSYQCQSVAFPLMATGTYRFPKDKGLSIAIGAFTDFLMTHDIRIILVVFDKPVFELAGQLIDGVHGYVDEKYVEATHAEEYGIRHCAASYQELTERISNLRSSEFKGIEVAVGSVAAQPKAPAELNDIMQQTGASFHKMLFQLIDERGLKDSEVYTRADMTRQQFSQIRRNPNYQPSKSAAIRFSLALKLDYETAQDFLSSAGYMLSQSIPVDIIIRYCIEHGEFNAVKINGELNAYNLPPLSKARE